MADLKVVIIGAGAMGSAIAKALVTSKTASAENVVAVDHNEPKCAALEALGIVTYEDAAQVPQETMDAADAIILAIKPQVIPAFLHGGKQFAGKLVISIAAGISTTSLKSMLPEAAIVRAMPNLPVAVLSGATALCVDKIDDSKPEFSAYKETALTIFSCMGKAVFMREDQLDAEGAVVGCGPAYFALMIDALTRAGVRAGMPAAAARDMSIATMKGVALMLESGEMHPREYMEKVTSPGGTTAAALYELEPALTDGVYAAVDGALERTRELAARS